jgi:uncharacterized protein (TIGR03086 family)
MDADPDDLAEATGAAEQVIAALTDEQLALSTPCAGWTVRDVVQHITGGNDAFASALAIGTAAGVSADAGSMAQRPAKASRAAGIESVDLLEAYRESVRRLLGAFRQPGALDKTVTVPFGTVPAAVALHLRGVELLVHGWDLARATGQPMRFPSELAERELAFTRPMLAEIPPDRAPFASPEPVADDAPAIDRLAACLGRQADERL